MGTLNCNDRKHRNGYLTMKTMKKTMKHLVRGYLLHYMCPCWDFHRLLLLLFYQMWMVKVAVSSSPGSLLQFGFYQFLSHLCPLHEVTNVAMFSNLESSFSIRLFLALFGFSSFSDLTRQKLCPTNDCIDVAAPSHSRSSKKTLWAFFLQTKLVDGRLLSLFSPHYGLVWPWASRQSRPSRLHQLTYELNIG